MHIYLIRHGQSTNNALEDPRLRVHDAPLTALGWQQAERLATHLATATDDPACPGYGITELYCSPMQRALQTAQPIGAALGLSPQVWVDLHENGGLFLEEEEGHIVGFPGLTRAEMRAAFPGYVLPDDVTGQGWWDPAAGQETVGRYGRAIRVALKLRARAGEDGRIALVTHGGFLSLLLEALTDQLPHDSRRQLYRHMNASLTLLDIDAEGQLAIHYLNRVDHLPLALRTW